MGAARASKGSDGIGNSGERQWKSLSEGLGWAWPGTGVTNMREGGSRGLRRSGEPWLETLEAVKRQGGGTPGLEFQRAVMY